MKALAMRTVGRPEVLEIDPPGSPGPGQVLVRMDMVALGVAEMRAVRGDRFRHFGQHVDPEDPFVFGFSGVGRVEDPGDSGFEPGQRLLISPLIGCGECEHCRAGNVNRCAQLLMAGLDVGAPGFGQELMVISAERGYPVPEGLSDELVSIAGEVATCVHAWAQGRLVAGEAAGVVGSGRHGRHAIRVAKALGAREIVAVDPSEQARALAVEAGADRAFDPASAPGDVELDAIIHAVSDETMLGPSLDLCGIGGRVVALGTPVALDVEIPDFFNRLVLAERELTGTLSKPPADFAEAMRLMTTLGGDWGVRSPRTIPLAQAPAALIQASEQWPLPDDVFIEVGER
jgi:threonine dehydrogenase-like Zn-dependent dehydrogenase